MRKRNRSTDTESASHDRPQDGAVGGGPVDRPIAFTAKQGQYLAFIYYYGKIHGRAPAEADFRRFFRVTPPVVHQMIKTLGARGFIDREPGKPRSIKLRVARGELPDLE
jgi:DNA-binding MarR family transcriptional regulator